MKVALIAICAVVLFNASCKKQELTIEGSAALIEADPKFAAFNPPALLPGESYMPCFRSEFLTRMGTQYAVIGEGKTFISGISLNGDQLLLQFRTPYKKNVKRVVSVDKQPDGSRNAVFEYGWDTATFPPQLKACIESAEPQQALAFMTYDSGKWTIKDMVVEKLELHPVSTR